jgi:GTPase Era involved in 16S rRNA processing
MSHPRNAVQVSAVSSKTNTTAAARLGAFTEGAVQVALFDTPGVVSTRCEHHCMASALAFAAGCDAIRQGCSVCWSQYPAKRAVPAGA